MHDRPVTIVGLLGSKLDAGVNEKRWQRWRPTVAACQHEELLVERFELLYQSQHLAMAEQVAADIASVSPETDVCLRKLDFDDPWDFEEVYGKLHDFARGSDFESNEGDLLIHISTGSHVQQICLFLLTESRHLPGRLLQTSPRDTDKGKASPVGVYRTIDLDLSQYDRLASRFAVERTEGVSFLKAGIETRSKKFNRLIERIEQVALNSDAPMLLTGPTGAGKSQLARRIFELKKHRGHVKGDLVEVNCAVLRGDQAMSALFGHVKGAFTGATTQRPGLLKTAHSGLLFLDEIGELGLDEQAMLLRALEDKRFLPVGADRDVASDFQLIAGTNRDLRQNVLDGRFREDLLARINLWTFELPGLADRKEDIEPNVAYELDRFANEHNRRVTFNKDGRDAFLKFATSTDAAWAANFRDLNAAMTRMATLAPSGRINRALVDEEVQRLTADWAQFATDVDASLLGEFLDDEAIADLDLFDRVQLAAVIRVCQESRSLSEAGRKLFAVSRQARSRANDADRLRKYLLRFDLSWQSITGD
ncbi:MAG: RNA repair transcriptional activator RtcR [Planctomycetota bacterium]|jgi:transcriptional regulatory protein RtcR